MMEHRDNSVSGKGLLPSGSPPSGSPRSWLGVTEPLDAGNLLELARQRSQESRESLASFMIELLDGQSGALSESERSLTSDILRTIIFKVERSIRDRLVSVIADIEACPYDLIWFLANEPIEIAYPILLRSTVLRDADLVELVQRKAIEHRMTIAARPNLSPAVSDTIARVAESEVIVRLLRNETAALGDSTLACLVERARTDQAIHEPLVKRPEMSADLARKLVHWVSDALREYILSHWTIPVATLDESLDAILEDDADLAEADETEAPPVPATQAVPGDLERLKRLTISAMGVGDSRLVVSLISAALGLRKALVHRVLVDRSSDSRAVVCRALGMTSYEFLTFSAAAARLEADASAGIDEDPATLATVYARVSAETARSVVAHWSGPR